MEEIKKISIIGAGCVGNFFAQEFYKRGFQIVEIISRKEKSAKDLSKLVNAKPLFGDFSNFDKNADLYIMSVKDEVIMELRNSFDVGKKIIVHTSGTVPSEVFKKSAINFGVLYPLQTIIKNRDIDIAKIPFFVYGNNQNTQESLFNFTLKFTDNVLELSDEKRQMLHLAAVYASNFTNYLLKISKDILDKENIDFNYLYPLVVEGIERAFEIGPKNSQTGPAKRGDCNITDKHKGLIERDDWRNLYSMITDMIKQDFKEK